MMRLPHTCTQRPQYVPSPPLSSQPYPNSPPVPSHLLVTPPIPTPPASPSGQQHPIRPLSLGAAQVMQNSREEHAECELIGLGFQIGAGRLRQSQCGFLCLMCLFLHSQHLHKPRQSRKINEFKSSHRTQR